MKVKVLGSVSSFSFKEKKGISFLVTSGTDKVVLDLGEGAMGNLNLPEDLENLTIIISHLHRDHFCGLLPLSYAAYTYMNHGLLKNKIRVFIPNDEDSVVKEYIKSLVEDSAFDIYEYDENTIIKGNNMRISFVKTIHGPLTLATKIEADDKTLVYSADTGYNGNPLESFAKNADLLICETTFLKNEPKPKDTHLTTIEAANIARTAGVKKLLLVHMWPTHEKMAYYNDVKFIFENVTVARENEEIEL